MSDYEEVRDTQVEFGCIAKLIDRISVIVDKLEWEELADMVADAFVLAEKEQEPFKMFVDWYQFFFRLYYRVKTYKGPAPFNRIFRDQRVVGHDEIQMYRVQNYDYKMFAWARKKGFTEFLTNDWFLVPVDKLTVAEKANFEKKVEKQ